MKVCHGRELEKAGRELNTSKAQKEERLKRLGKNQVTIDEPASSYIKKIRLPREIVPERDIVYEISLRVA